VKKSVGRKTILVALGAFSALALSGWSGRLLAGGSPDRKQCSQAEARAAEDVVGRLKTWAAVQDAYARFGHCDDGSIGQGFSESITILLSRKWDRLNDLRRAAAKDKEFESFVIRHIDLTVPVERLEVIAKNARQRCGKGEPLCERIAKRADER
jgi:hypothetical protein